MSLEEFIVEGERSTKDHESSIIWSVFSLDVVRDCAMRWEGLTRFMMP